MSLPPYHPTEDLDATDDVELDENVGGLETDDPPGISLAAGRCQIPHGAKVHSLTP
jgi:hypothetical protein